MPAGDIRNIVNALLLTKSTVSSTDVATAAGITRQAVHRHLQALIREGMLVSDGKGRATRYSGAARRSTWRLPREGLSEDEVWRQVRTTMPTLSEPRYANAAATLSYAFTEMVNNAIDHSRADIVGIAAEIRAGRARFVIEDDGIGAFENVRATRDLPSPLEALQEISKGKLSTAPERHSGEGIFFTSKVTELFELEANGLRWTVDNIR
ncbi:MAG: ATP-binding protein, partial [Myxococcales bacterium]